MPRRYGRSIPVSTCDKHSPTGFEWGYVGSGPAQLSLALLADALGDDERAQDLYQQFKCLGSFENERGQVEFVRGRHSRSGREHRGEQGPAGRRIWALSVVAADRLLKCQQPLQYCNRELTSRPSWPSSQPAPWQVGGRGSGRGSDSSSSTSGRRRRRRERGRGPSRSSASVT